MGYCQKYRYQKTASVDIKFLKNRLSNQDKYRLYNSVMGKNGIIENQICGIINIGNNCYLNSGLQILASFPELVNELNKAKNSYGITPLLKDAFYNLLNETKYNPSNFINEFCRKNSDFIRGSQCCSQNFIRTLIRNINSESQYDKIYENNQYKPSEKDEIYDKFIRSNRIYPESRIQSIFSIMTKSNTEGICRHCNKQIEYNSFGYFIDLNLYLDEINNNCSFFEVLKRNIGYASNLTMDCPKCKREICLKEKTKFIKLPDILIFTLERFQNGKNPIKITPDLYINMNDFTDKYLKQDCMEYELIAINIRLGKTANCGHEICQVKRNGYWYEINDNNYQQIRSPSYSYYDSSYGLFYRKMKNNYSMKSYSRISRMEIDDEEKDLKNSCSDNFSSNKSENFKGNIKTISENNKNIKFTKIKNYGNKDINSGLEILSLCNDFINELKTFKRKDNSVINLTKDAIDKILSEKERQYDAYPFTEIYKYRNNSQNFILEIIKMINSEFIQINKTINIRSNLYSTSNSKNNGEYDFFHKMNQESRAMSFFTSIIKYQCKKCNNNIASEEPIIQNIFLMNKSINKFSELFEENFKLIDEITKCNKCRKAFDTEINKKFIYLPIYLMFYINTEKLKYNKKIEIIIDDIDMIKFLEPSSKEINTKYELFATNIKKNNIDACQVKRDGKWYEICEGEGKEINKPILDNSTYGLYFRKIRK